MNSSPSNSLSRIREVCERTFAMHEFAIKTLPNHRIAIRLLSEEDLDNCRLEAIRYVKARQVDTLVDGDELLTRETRREILLRCTFIAGETADAAKPDPQRFFSTPAEVRMLDSVTIDRLFAAYRETQERIEQLYTLTPPEVDALVEMLVGPKPEIWLATLTDDALRKLVHSLAARCRELQPPASPA